MRTQRYSWWLGRSGLVMSISLPVLLGTYVARHLKRMWIASANIVAALLPDIEVHPQCFPTSWRCATYWDLLPAWAEPISWIKLKCRVKCLAKCGRRKGIFCTDKGSWSGLRIYICQRKNLKEKFTTWNSEWAYYSQGPLSKLVIAPQYNFAPNTATPFQFCVRAVYNEIVSSVFTWHM